MRRTTRQLDRIEQALEGITAALARLEGRPHPATPADLGQAVTDAVKATATLAASAPQRKGRTTA